MDCPKNHSQDILDSITEGVFTVDLDWNITFFNKAAEKITGFKKEEALNSKCYEIFKANVCESSCFLRETMDLGKNILNRRINITNNKGEIVPIAVNTSILTDKNKKLIGGIETFKDCCDIELLQKQLKQSYTFHDIIGKGPKTKEILSILPDVAQSNSTVLIQGPSGSGKEVFAKAIHTLSKRSKNPFIAINCGAIPHNLLESEFFGHVRGAFTDAKYNKPGKFKLAEGGTIFLDEIGDLPLLLQVKLLRLIQEKEYEPVGGIKSYKTDVRIILATNKNLLQLVSENKFREDLYFRINVIKLTLPPIAERREDIPLFVSHFIKIQNNITNKKIENISEEVMHLFMQYDFPGNIRELQNIIEYAFILCNGPTIEMQHLPIEVTSFYKKNRINNSITKISSPDYSEHNISSFDSFCKLEADMIRKKLEDNKWNRKKTAKDLGINASTLWRKMQKHQIC
ncbi:MAG: sigma 54-interacting transcriptional regulator [Oligoflexia bacterium]|nr:sigma 54-interacting transcriptional regulator [Oligoflexia bacterium]